MNKIGLILALLVGLATRGAAAPAPVANPPAEPPQAEARRVAEAVPVVDGNVRDDPAWSGIEPLTEFWQTAPDAGFPASQPTEVRILYTETMLYFGVICFDDDPSGIVVSQSRRDSPLDDTDSFQIILDTYLDRQYGFVFGTNPTGLEYDGQVTNEGEGGRGPGRGQGSSLGGFNPNWNGIWTVNAVLGDFGWSAEFAIPFSTLRYDRKATRTWGMNFQRNIRRRNEQAFWSPLSRQFNLFRLSQAGTLGGLEPPRPRNLQILPYVRGDATEAPELGLERTTEADAGGDLKWSVTPSLTLDLTVNTDFLPRSRPTSSRSTSTASTSSSRRSDLSSWRTPAPSRWARRARWRCSSAAGSASVRRAGWCRSLPALASRARPGGSTSAC